MRRTPGLKRGSSTRNFCSKRTTRNWRRTPPPWRTRTVQAQLNFFWAQISLHFIYNALTAIESHVLSDPERARDLLIGFAEFIRWTFREHSQYATLALSG